MQENKNLTTYAHDDEINLGELFIKLWGQKWVIGGAVFICALLAVAYAFVRPVNYEVKAVLTPPSTDQLYDLNLNGLTNYSPEGIFKLYFKELKSPVLLRAFYQQQKMYESTDSLDTAEMTQYEMDAAFLRFQSNMNVENSTPEFLQKTNDGKIVAGSEANLLQADIFWVTDDSPRMAEFINGYIEFVNQKLMDKVYKEQVARKQQQLSELKRTQDLVLTVEKKQRELKILKLQEEQNIAIAKIEAQIESTTNNHYENLESQIAELKEALSIAKGLDIVKPKSLANFYSESNLASQIEIYTADNKELNKRYLLGADFLNAEIQELEKRRNNTYFIEGLAELNQKLIIAKNNPELKSLQNRIDDKPYVEEYISTLSQIEKLEKINLDFKNSKVYQVAQPAIAPGVIVGKGKVIFLALGIVLGGVLGLMLALVRIAVINYKEKNQNA